MMQKKTNSRLVAHRFPTMSQAGDVRRNPASIHVAKQRRNWWCSSLCLAAMSIGWLSNPLPSRADNTSRRTPLVQAVQNAQPSVVNLRGRKTVNAAQGTTTSEDQARHVNGMGTGVVIDPRGYILTNYHVVQDVQHIQVTTADRQMTTATLVAHDPHTDLALLKIATSQPLPVISIGTSSDLMLAETVAAMGNAYGYDNTVTTGIISHLGRTVKVNEHQTYENLIQTDAPINPGNSGGPLLNLDGHMVGINVAVRVGAQGIAFAIPVNDAMAVAAELFGQINANRVEHGLTLETIYENHRPQLIVKAVAPQSAGAIATLQPGDRIVRIDGLETHLAVDFQRALIDHQSGDLLQLEVSRPKSDTIQPVTLKLAGKSTSTQPSNLAWKTMGLQLAPVPDSEMQGRHPSYQRGLRITRVRPDSPADREGIVAGDILVAMHGWKTESLENLAYILEQPDLRGSKSFMFYVLREKEPFFGQMRLAENIRD